MTCTEYNNLRYCVVFVERLLVCSLDLILRLYNLLMYIRLDFIVELSQETIVIDTYFMYFGIWEEGECPSISIVGLGHIGLSSDSGLGCLLGVFYACSFGKWKLTATNHMATTALWF